MTAIIKEAFEKSKKSVKARMLWLLSQSSRRFMRRLRKQDSRSISVLTFRLWMPRPITAGQYSAAISKAWSHEYWQAAGAQALEEDGYFRANCRRIIETRNYVSAELQKRGFTLTDSQANFLFAKSDRIGGETLYRRLREKGVLIRHFTKDRIKNYNRITIGSREEMEIFLQKTDEILEELV